MAFVSYTVREAEIDSRIFLLYYIFHYPPFSSLLALAFQSAADIQYQPAEN